MPYISELAFYDIGLSDRVYTRETSQDSQYVWLKPDKSYFWAADRCSKITLGQEWGYTGVVSHPIDQLCLSAKSARPVVSIRQEIRFVEHITTMSTKACPIAASEIAIIWFFGISSLVTTEWIVVDITEPNGYNEYARLLNCAYTKEYRYTTSIRSQQVNLRFTPRGYLNLSSTFKCLTGQRQVESMSEK